MIYADPKQLEMAFVKPGTPMFSDLVVELAEDTTLTDVRRRDLASGLRGVAKAIGRPPEIVPADLRWLQPRLEKVAPAALAISDKSWSNTLSNARAAMIHCGISKPRASRRKDLSPAWLTLWTALQASDEKSIGFALSNFLFFLSAINVAPEDVCDADTLSYREALGMDEIRKSPDDTYRKAVCGWNRAVKRFDFWPQQTLTFPSRSKRIALHLEELPESFQRDFESYLTGLASPDPLALGGLLAPLRPASIKTRRQSVLRFTGFLAQAGIGIGSLTSMAALVSPDVVECGLRWMLARKDGKTAPDIDSMAAMLLTIAKQYVDMPEGDIAKLEHLSKRLAMPRQKGMTKKNRDRLRPLDDKDTRQKFLLLPQRLFAKAEAAGLTPKSMLQREDALALAILQICPIRRKNLVEIHLDRNLQRPGNGRVYLIFEEEEVKNCRQIEFQLPDDVVRMIDHYVAVRSPLICPAGSPWLFPRRDGNAPMDPAQMSTKISNRIKRELGLDFNAHLHRHLAASIWLDDRPGSYEAIRRILGHSSTSTTLSAYAGFEAGTAARLFSEVIEKARNA
ncbi:MAG: tyrosine-type recombinase/integrase [Pseudomonadota bacterium]